MDDKVADIPKDSKIGFVPSCAKYYAQKYETNTDPRSTKHTKLQNRRTKNVSREVKIMEAQKKKKSKPHKSQLVTCLQIKDKKNFYALKQAEFQEIRCTLP